jgi:small subunit ribosomal protein S15
MIGWTTGTLIISQETDMSLVQEDKQKIITDYQKHETDTGSVEVQVAMLTERISRLSNHLKTNKKDHGSRIGLLKMISLRKRLLGYVQKIDYARYKTLIGRLGLRG